MIFQFSEQLEQVFTVVFVKGGRRFIKDKQLHVFAQSFGDFYELLLAYTQIFDQYFRINVQLHFIQHFLGLDDRLIPIDHRTLLYFIPCENILVNSQIRKQRKLLINDRNTGFDTIANFAEALNLAFEHNVTSISPMRIYATEHFH
ncbi:hypothetical protein D3C76_290300 [compost metagenome]